MEYRRRCTPFNCACATIYTLEATAVELTDNKCSKAATLTCQALGSPNKRPSCLQTPDDSYVHWCVDINKVNTKLYHIPIHQVQRSNDVRSIKRLKLAYNSDCGWRRWFSLTACYGVRFIMVRTVFGLRSAKDRWLIGTQFERAHRTEELVACGSEDLPYPKTNAECKHYYVDPRHQFLRTLETSLMHDIHNPRGCTAQDITDILDRIPKEIGGKLEHRFSAVGWDTVCMLYLVGLSGKSWLRWRFCSLGLWYSLSVDCVGILVSCRMLLLYQHT